MKKVFVTERHSLNREMLEEQLCIVPSRHMADMAIAWKTDVPGMAPAKTIMCQSEPPVARARVAMYQRFGEYHTVLRFDPSKALNEFPFSGDNPHLFPYMPWLSRRTVAPRFGQSDGIYFAGKAGPGRNSINVGYPEIYQLRAELAWKLRKWLGGHIFGDGFSESTKQAECGWHEQKMRDIDRLNPRFVLAIENCRMPGYVSEKLWDGIISDRVTLYLGAPDIEEYVDPGAYVHLDDFVDGMTFDAHACVHELGKRDPYEIRDCARGVLDSIGYRAKREQAKCTQFVIDRIKGVA